MEPGKIALCIIENHIPLLMALLDFSLGVEGIQAPPTFGLEVRWLHLDGWCGRQHPFAKARAEVMCNCTLLHPYSS
jgi:hypothetical protein